MIDRYSLPEMSSLFSEEAKMSRWAAIEIAVVRALAHEGRIPAADAKKCAESLPRIDTDFVSAVEAREAVTQHDLAAFVDVLQDKVGMPHASWIHHGLTSTDVVDTGWCWALRDAASLIEAAMDDLIALLVSMAREHKETVMMGRTHGIHAEPTTFGSKVALWALQVARDRDRLRAARSAVAVCKLSGAVGTYSNIDPSVEARVAEELGLVSVPATQVIARDRHAEYLWACASIATTIESIAVELRHLQRTEVGEVREGFRGGQKGSSAMPHKRNPISAETLTGLSRVVRANLQVGLENVPLWHERDISHSSAERVVLPDSSLVTHYMVKRLTSLLTGLEVDAERMRANIEMLNGAVFSQSVLLALVDSGLARDDAYRIVQSASADTIANAFNLRDVLSRRDDVPLTPTQLDEIFDVGRVVRHAGRVVESIDELR